MEAHAPVECSDDVPANSCQTEPKVPLPSNGQTGREVLGVPYAGLGVPTHNSGQTNHQVPAPDTAQIGRDVPSDQLGGPQGGGDLAMDAQRFDRSHALPQFPPAQRAPRGGEAAFKPVSRGGNVDSIEVPGPHGMIRGTGIFANLPSGASVNIAGVSHSVVHNYGDGTKAVSTCRTVSVPNRLKITESQARPELRHFKVVTTGLSSGDWQKLGRRLGLEDSRLNHLHTDHEKSGVEEIIHQMLVKWTQACHPATLNALASALQLEGYGDLADEISRMC